ncbi:predicted protein [Arabidopsis lyrata subsp. lyrata]|uniref:Predicted protein n=1 Tax=Arabidopsis lyrata subsp. lyrata TaxID=81972 RepID=D7KL73_ARALL|nr:predicted protein [Arabidopsis lyrata subsp. lyrata]
MSQRTSRPAHYHLLLDEIGFSSTGEKFSSILSLISLTKTKLALPQIRSNCLESSLLKQLT